MRSKTQLRASASGSTRTRATSPVGDTTSATPGSSSFTSSVPQLNAAWIAGRSEATTATASLTRQ